MWCSVTGLALNPSALRGLTFVVSCQPLLSAHHLAPTQSPGCRGCGCAISYSVATLRTSSVRTLLRKSAAYGALDTVSANNSELRTGTCASWTGPHQDTISLLQLAASHFSLHLHTYFSASQPSPKFLGHFAHSTASQNPTLIGCLSNGPHSRGAQPPPLHSCPVISIDKDVGTQQRKGSRCQAAVGAPNKRLRLVYCRRESNQTTSPAASNPPPSPPNSRLFFCAQHY